MAIGRTQGRTRPTLCTVCGKEPTYYNRIYCVRCLGEREPEGPSRDERHLKLLRATGRDFAGRRLS